MKKIYFKLLIILLCISPIFVSALSEDETRKAITDYAYYVYNNKKSEFSYVSPSNVNMEKILLGYKTQNNTYATDCNAFVGFVIYNALRIEANANGKIPQPSKGDGPLNSSGRAALNGVDGWSSHSMYYDSKRYALQKGETVQSAVSRINLQSKLKPGDLIGIVAYASSESKDKYTHIMVYVGDGNYIHNSSKGVSLDSLSSISFGNRVGSSFQDDRGNMGPHGSITVLSLKNYESLSSTLLNGFRYPKGNGGFIIENQKSSGDSGNPSKPRTITIPGHYEPVSEELHLCERKDTAKIINLIYLLVQIIRVVVPIILIIGTMIKLIKAMTSPNEINRIKKTIITNVVAAILIFLVPTFVDLITMITGSYDDYHECLEFSKNPKDPYIWVEEQTIEENNNTDSSKTDSSKDITINKNGTYINLISKNVSGYYFSNKKETLTAVDTKWIESNKNVIDFVLLPGTYYIYVRTKDGNIHSKTIDVKPSDIVVTNDSKDIKLLTTSLDNFLKSKNSSITELNEAIARSVYIAGGSSKSGAAAGALALTQILYKKYKIKIPYGNIHGSNLVMGAPSNWGSTDVNSNEKKGSFNNQGIHCGGFVTWSYYQANFDMNSGIGSSAQICGWGYGSLKRISSNNKGQVGDVLTTAKTCNESKHVSIINAIDDKGYYLTEANARTKTINTIRTMIDNIGVVTTYDTFVSNRWTTYLDMSLTVNKKKRSTILQTGF